MGVIGEIVEGIIKGIHHIFKNRDRKVNGWERLHPNKVPSWIEKASHKYYIKWGKSKRYDLRKDFKGKHYLYRVYYKRAAHGRVREEYYRRKKR